MADAEEDMLIIREVLDGEVNAYAKLVDKYKKLVYSRVQKHVSGDMVEGIVQQIFIEVYKSLSNFKGESKFSTWLTTISMRCCYDYYKKKKRNQESPLSQFSEDHNAWLDSVGSEIAERSFSQAEQQQHAREVLAWAMDQLPAGDRMVLALVYLEGRSIKETAKILEISSISVRVKSHRGRAKLKDLITNQLQRLEENEE